MEAMSMQVARRSWTGRVDVSEPLAGRYQPGGPPALVHETLAAAIEQYGDRPALSVKRGGRWLSLTWREYGRQVERAAAALIELGVAPAEGVVILAQNRPEWLIANLGAILCGAAPAGIYTTSSAEQVRYITDHCAARVAFADTPEQISKLLAEKARLPRLEVVVHLAGTATREAGAGSVRVMGWEEFLALGDATDVSLLDTRQLEQQQDDVCALIYTSGTTGEPKGVTLTHANLVWTARSIVRAFGAGPDDVLLSYLPLCHIAEQMISIHVALVAGSHVFFAESIERLAENLSEVRPTLFFGVPRVWEKIRTRMLASSGSAGPLRRRLVAWARKIGLEAGWDEQRGAARSPLYPIARRLVFDRVRQRLGLDRARICITSAAPIAPEVLEFFLSFGIPVLETYGMSECTGPITCSVPGRYRLGRCGQPLPGAEIELAQDGEILVRGRHVFKGYLKDPDATRQAFDERGWLRTGDIGALDVDGFLQIIDRKKDLIITSGGKNVAPRLLEAQLERLPAVAQAVVIGDRRSYLVALLTLDPERVQHEAELAGSSARSVRDAASCPSFRQHVERQIAVVNAKVSRVEAIKRFTILAREFSIAGGELTPTLKVKRKLVSQKYQAEIDALYEASSLRAT